MWPDAAGGTGHSRAAARRKVDVSYLVEGTGHLFRKEVPCSSRTGYNILSLPFSLQTSRRCQDNVQVMESPRGELNICISYMIQNTRRVCARTGTRVGLAASLGGWALRLCSPSASTCCATGTSSPRSLAKPRGGRCRRNVRVPPHSRVDTRPPA